MKNSLSLLITCALCLLTACGSSTNRSPRDTDPNPIKIAPTDAVVKCPDIPPLLGSVDLAKLMHSFNDTINLYNTCSARDSAAVDYIHGIPGVIAAPVTLPEDYTPNAPATLSPFSAIN